MKKVYENINKGNLAIIIVVLLIFGIICYEVFSVTHIELKTQTATISTVYETINAQALVIRQEKVIENNTSGVTVPTLSDGDKINVGGNLAMVFNSDEEANNYSKFLELQDGIKYYETLGSQTVGQASGLETINKDIEQKVIDYAYGANSNTIDQQDEELNSVLIRRQLIIGEQVDLSKHIEELGAQAAQYSSSKPVSYITTDTSGVFSTYTDGYENIIDYDKAEATTIEEFQKALAQVDEEKDTSKNLGKLVVGYDWYIQAEVDCSEVQDLKNGKTVTLALKDDQNTEIKAEIVTGAEPDLGQEKTLLVLKCNVMTSNIPKLRKTEIEIRKKSYEGFKIPFETIHVVDGKKGVYVLIASQVKFREVNVIYSDDDNVLVEYDSSNTNGIHLYDKIITRGKDLEDGKVYT